jgi:hypothetical protein
MGDATGGGARESPYLSRSVENGGSLATGEYAEPVKTYESGGSGGTHARPSVRVDHR